MSINVWFRGDCVDAVPHPTIYIICAQCSIFFGKFLIKINKYNDDACVIRKRRKSTSNRYRYPSHRYKYSILMWFVHWKSYSYIQTQTRERWNVTHLICEINTSLTALAVVYLMYLYYRFSGHREHRDPLHERRLPHDRMQNNSGWSWSAIYDDDDCVDGDM